MKALPDVLAYRSRLPAPLIPGRLVDAEVVNGPWKRARTLWRRPPCRRRDVAHEDDAAALRHRWLENAGPVEAERRKQSRVLVVRVGEVPACAQGLLGAAVLCGPECLATDEGAFVIADPA